MEGYTITDMGKMRTTNQDYSFCSCNRIGNLDNLFLVADGMGGHKAGDYASSFVANEIVSQVYRSTDDNPIEILRNAIDIANEGLFKKSTENVELAGTGTTLVAATMAEDILYVANIGDSRLYLCRSTLRKITKDHSLVEELVALGKITKDSPEYNKQKNVITRAVGTSPTVMIDFFEEHTRPGDLILMCSDGLTGMVSEGDIEIILKENNASIEEKAHKLVDLANQNGGMDNIAILIIEIN